MDIMSAGKDSLRGEEPITSSIGSPPLASGQHFLPQKSEADTILTRDQPVFKSPLNFATLTVEQLGITPGSFTNSSPGKSPYLLKKSRRRSTIGTRGSPETNHLIRYIAQQKNLKSANKSPLAQSPSSAQACHFSHRNGVSLKEQISAFQSVFHPMEENEGKPCFSGFLEEEEGEFQVTGYVKNESPRNSGDFSSKRRRVSYQQDLKENTVSGENKLAVIPKDCRVTFSEGARASGVDQSLSCDEQPSVAQSGCFHLGAVPLADLSGTLNGAGAAGSVLEEISSNEASKSVKRVKMEESPHLGILKENMLPSTPLCKREVTSHFTLRSVLKKTPVKSLSGSWKEHRWATCEDGSQPLSFSNTVKDYEELKSDGGEAGILITQKTWQKKVTFGEYLSPEVFDESLPANTPLRRGGTPARQQDLRNLSPPEPHLFPTTDALAQLNFDDDESLGNTEQLQVSCGVPPVGSSPSSEILNETKIYNSPNKDESTSPLKDARITRSSSKRKIEITHSSKQFSIKKENANNSSEIESKTEKAMKPNRKKPHGPKGKTTSQKIPMLRSGKRRKGKGKRKVEKSLYGKREMASKIPPLSPIPEIPESPGAAASPHFKRPESLCSSDYFNFNIPCDKPVSPELREPVERTRRKSLPQNNMKMEDSKTLQTIWGFDECSMSGVEGASPVTPPVGDPAPTLSPSTASGSIRGENRGPVPSLDPQSPDSGAKFVNIKEEAANNSAEIESQTEKAMKPNRKKPQGSKGKTTSQKIPGLRSGKRRKGKGKRKVEKSLYGKREMASKKPPLSPVPEISESPGAAASPHFKRPESLSGYFNFDIPCYEPTSPVPREPVERPRRKSLPQNSMKMEDSKTLQTIWGLERNASGIEGAAPVSPPVPTLSPSKVGGNIRGENRDPVPSSEPRGPGWGPKEGSGSLSGAQGGLSVTDPESALPPLPVLPLPSPATVPPQPGGTPAPPGGVASSVSGSPKTSLTEPGGGQETNIFTDGWSVELEEPDGVDVQEGMEETASQSCQEFEREESAENRMVTSYQKQLRRRRRSSVYYPDYESVHIEGGNEHPGSHYNSSTEELFLEGNSDLYNNLAYSIGQALEPGQADETRVRRSMRLQKGSDSQGLVWISDPNATSLSSLQKTNRRTICASHGRDYETIHRQESCVLFSTSNEENSETLSVGGSSHGLRRKSFCSSAFLQTGKKPQTKRAGRASLSYTNKKNRSNDCEVLEKKSGC
ncbi:cell division cycle-associated protein 2 isoform X2 [Ornithorhynchus anatinus]|uniref:cell division cycle-associated protein 2 isoform X2 n=1 Tax=Ornithorhynchus anatinus TaxID=9258 RepID=UPI0010A78C95|nr:cell division cycle-associated protein 2 isoform X2 [Ornithorhynchus anatinus]